MSAVRGHFDREAPNLSASRRSVNEFRYTFRQTLLDRSNRSHSVRGTDKQVASRDVSATAFNQIAISALIALELGIVLALFRILVSDPAPGIFAGSLRRAATRMLRPAKRDARISRRLRSIRAVLWRVHRPITILLAAGLLAIPARVTWGPLANSTQSTSYLQALWVVVAASLGLSVAMVAFAFQAFVSIGRDVHGGTLREFADETRLLDAIGFGILTLVIIGTVLLHVGHESPHGWAAACATAFSVATLFGVLYVVNRVLVSLDERELLRMRSRRLERTVQRAMFEQLREQAAQSILQTTRMPIRRAYLPPRDSLAIPARKSGEIYDVKLGTLTRAMKTQGSSAELAVSIGNRIDKGEPLMWLLGAQGRPSWSVRRAVKIGRGPREKLAQALLEQLGQLHQQAVQAARDGLEDRWRQIADGYEQVLLALPPAAAEFDIPFAGIVAAPGFFGIGPLQRIQRYLFEETRAAIDADNAQVVEEITAFPSRIAARAVEIGAPTIATSMLALYPDLYQLALERSK